jgi:transposase-like protein
MASKGRRKFSAEFKLDTVMEGLRGAKSIAQICRGRDITESLYHKWKAIFQERASEIFEDRRSSSEDERERQIAELERLVGRLTMEVEVLKKARSWLDTPSGRNGR